MTEPSDALDERSEHPEEVWVKKEFGLMLHHLQQLPEQSRARVQASFAQKLMDQTMAVDTPRGPLSFVLLGKPTAGRAATILRRQPATIAWIDSFRPNGVFWDIGANVGIYTLYAALRRDIRVVAFEPAGVNYFLLAANCEVNKLDNVDCLLLGVGSEKTIGRLEVSQFEPAQSFSFRGKPDQQHRGRQAALILSMDQLIDEYALPCPNYIKIDAPGLSEAIIAGAARLLKREEVRQVHMEVREQAKGGQRIVEMLRQHGFAVAGRNAHAGSTDVTFERLA